jgi:MEMO1 family protein
MTSRDAHIRPAAVAGRFYPGTKLELETEMKELLGASAEASDAELCALIVPHAGYLYSGTTAGRAYALLEGRTIDTCVLIGPSHQEYFLGVSAYPGDAYETPFGLCKIDHTLRAALIDASPLIRLSTEGHRNEHSLEVQVPFIQTVLPSASIVPLVIGDLRAESYIELGEAIARVLAHKPRVLLVASSDLSHFYPSDVARVKDAEALRLIEAFDTRGFLRELETETIEACGGGPIAAVMTAAYGLGARRAQILHACNSGDITGDTSRVVGYCSAALWRTP